MTSNDTNDPWVNAMYLSLGIDLARASDLPQSM